MMSSFLRKRGSSNGKDHGESKAIEFQAIGVSDPTIQRSCWGFLFLLILKFLVVLFYLYLSRKYLVDEVYEMEGLRELDLSVKTTIVVIAPENVSHLKSFILHYSLCRNIHEIAVIWHSKDSPPELSSFPFQHTHSKVSFISNQEATLVNLLFEQRVSPVTESILLLDADVFLDCENVAFSVSVWSSSINSLVGYFPRTHRVGRDDTKKFSYGGSMAVYNSGSYSTVLSSGAIVPSIYYKRASASNEFKAYFEKDDGSRLACIPLSMSLWSAVIESAPPPIWIDVPVSLHSGAKVLNVDKYFQGNRNTFKSMSLDQQRNECLHDLITFLVNLKNNLANDKDSKIDPEFILGHSHYKSTIAKNYLFW